MTSKKQKKEPWLTDSAQITGVFTKKSFHRSATGGWQVWRENPPVAFSQLDPDELLDTGELLRYFGCSLPTLYRWIAKRGLEPSRRIGRELFFRKRDVKQWIKKTGRPRPGRPKRKGGEDAND